MSSYEHRARAAGRNRQPKPGQLVAVLDLGATKIACLIGKYGTSPVNGIEIVGFGQQTSRGLRSGAVIDMEGLERSIRLAVEDAERMAGVQISNVRLAISGPYLKTRQAVAEMDMGGREITQKDVEKLLHLGMQSSEKDEFFNLHSVPVSYIIDGNDGVRDPRGMFADKLGVRLNLISMPQAIYKNLTLCVSRAHLSVESMVAGPYMAAEAVLVEDERDNGAVCIDMGGGSTAVSVYLNGTLAHLDSVALGGQHVTSDLAHGLGTTLPAAERIKTLHGSVLPSKAKAKIDLVETPKIGDDGRLQAAQTPRSDLVDFMTPRVEEIFEMVSAKLSESGLGGKLPRRAILTGGASEMPGVREIASRVLAMPVRLGKPVQAAELGEVCQRSAFSTATGLVTFNGPGAWNATRKKKKTGSGSGSSDGWLARLIDWFKENF